MSRVKNLLKNTLIIGIGTILPKLASLITLPIITAYLTKAELGTFDLISTLASLFLPIVTLQLSTAAFRFLIDCRNDFDETSTIISNIIGFIIPSSIIALVVLFFYLYKIDYAIRILIVLYYFGDIVLIVFQQIARGLSYNKKYSASSIVQSLTNIVLIIFFVSGLRMGLEGGLVSATVAVFSSSIYLFFSCKIKKYINLKLLRKEKLAPLLKYSWPLIPNSMSLWILSVSDRLVLSMFIGIEVTAVYAVANKIPSLLTTAQNTFVYAWQENASIAVGDSDANEYYSRIFSVISRLLAGAMGLIIGCTPLAFKLLVKGDYSEAFTQMPILFLAVYFSCISSFIGGVYVAHKKTVNVGSTTIIAAIINLTIDFAFVNLLGIYAASISTLIAYVFLSVYRMINVRKFQKITYNYVEIIVICIGLTILSFLSSESISIKAFANLLLGVVFAVVMNLDFLRLMKKKLGGKLRR